MPQGRRPLPWIKLWFDMLNDVKMNRLSAAEKWCWIGILLLAGQAPERGKLMLTETQPMSIRDISKALNLTNREIFSLKSCISKMIELDSLRWNSNNCLEVTKFKKRQETYASDLKDYHKKGQINSELTPEKVLKEEEGRGEKKDITSPNGEVYSPKIPNETKELFDLWNSLGLIKHRALTGDMKRAIKATSRDFSAAEISQAMKNYAHIVNDEQYYFKHKWTMKNFLKRGLEMFMDLEVAKNNYRKGGAGGADKKYPSQLKPRDQYTSPEEFRRRGKPV